MRGVVPRLLQSGGFARKIELAAERLKRRVKVRASDVRFDPGEFSKAARQRSDELVGAVLIRHCIHLHGTDR